MIAAALTTLLLHASTDTLSTVTIDRLTFKAPTKWAVTDDENGKSWASDEDAKFSVSVFPVDPQRPAAPCLAQIIEALKWEAPTKVAIGTFPAAKLVEHAFTGEEGEKKEENKVTTTTYVGCDGRTKWVLTFATKTSRATRFGPVLKKIVDSIKYGKK